MDRRDSDVAIQLGDVAEGVVPIQHVARRRAVDAVAGVEGIGIIEEERAYQCRARTVVVGISEIGVDTVETEDAASFLDEGTRRAVGPDTAGEDDHVGVGGTVHVELHTAIIYDSGEVRGGRNITRERIGREVRDCGRETERRTSADESDWSVAEHRPRIGDVRHFDDAVGAVLPDDRTADVGVGARHRRIEDGRAVAVVRRTAGEDDGGVAGDAVGVGQVSPAAAEAEGRLAVEDVGLEGARESQVFVRTKAHAREVGPTEVERLSGGGDAQGDGTGGTEGDLVQDGGLDAREVRDDRTVGSELNRGRRTEAGQAVEAIAARTDIVGASPTGVISGEVDRTVAPTGAGGEIEVTEELGADGREGARRADARVTHQVERTAEGRVIAEADDAMEGAGGTRAFFPAVADDIPVTGQGAGIVPHHELTAVVSVDVDVAVGAGAERRRAGVGYRCGVGDRRRLAEGKAVTGDRSHGGACRDTCTYNLRTDGGTGGTRDGQRRGGGGRRRSGGIRSDAHAQTTDISVTRVGVVRAEHDVITTRAYADETTEGDIRRSRGDTRPEHRVDVLGIAVGEDDEFTASARDDGASGQGRSARGGAEENTTRRNRKRIGRTDRRGQGVGVVETQRVDRLRSPITRVRDGDVEIVTRRISGGGERGSGVTRGADRGEPTTHVLADPFVDARGVGGRDGVSRAISVGKDRAGGTGGRLDAVAGAQRIGGLGDEQRRPASARDGAEIELEGVREMARQNDVRGARADRGGGEGLRVGAQGREQETTAAVADVGEFGGGELECGLRSRSPTEDEHRGGRDEVGRRGGVETQLEGADLIRRAARHARRASDDGRRARVSLDDSVDVEVARTDLGQAAGTGEDRAVGRVLAAIADAQGDRIIGVIGQRHVDRGAEQAADREGARGDTGVEDDAGRVHHIRDVDAAVGQGVGVLEKDGTVDDRGISREGVGSAEGEHAVADLGQAAGEAFTRTARGGAVADRARELDVIAVGIEQDGADERDAARDGARTGGDVGRGARRPTEGAALDSQTARAGAVTGRGTVRQDLESAAGVEDESALEGVRAREGHRRADDVDTGLIAAADCGGVIEHAAAAAEAVDAGDTRSEDASVSDVTHAGAEAHASKVRTRLAEVDVRRGRGRGDGDDAGARGAREAVDFAEGIRRIRDNRAALGDDEEAADLGGVEGRGVKRATGTDGDDARVERQRGLEGVDAGKCERTEAALDEAPSGVRRVERADGDDSAGAAAAREGDGRDGASHIGARAGDDDARDLSAADDGIARGRGAARHEAGSAEGDGRSTDVAGAAGDRKVGLRETGAGCGGEASEGYRETVGVDRERAVSRGTERAVVNRAEERVRPEAVRRRDPIVSGEVGTARVLERRQDARGHRGVGPERAAREIIVAEVTAAGVHGDRGVVAQRHRAR